MMNHVNVKNCIVKAIESGDILLIIPPFATIRTPILGPLLLRTIGETLGFKTCVLHLNLLLASLIGVNTYESICYNQPFRMLGERLFARSAHDFPPLGKNTELCNNPAASVFGKERQYSLQQFEYKYYKTDNFNLTAYLDIEEICFSLINCTAAIIASMDYKIIGCSSNWEQNNASASLLKRIKNAVPHVLTIMGGSNCEGEMAEGILSLSNSPDYIFSGESENSFASFLRQFSAGKLPENRIITAQPVETIDDIPAPLLDSYIAQRELFFDTGALPAWNISYETSRGCWWDNCHFCGLNGVNRGGFREKSPDKVIKELDDLHKYYPQKAIVMIDKVMPPSYFKTLLPLLSKKDNLPAMSYEQRSGLTLEDMILLKKSNIISIKPGIEALSDGLLTLMNKGVAAAQNLLLLRHARSLDIYVDWNLLWGFPGDKKEFYEETLRLIPLIKHLCPPAVFRHLSIDRFSPYFEHSELFGITGLIPWAAYESVYPKEVKISKLAYRFIGDYSSGAHDCQELIGEIGDAIKVWKKDWEKTQLVMAAFGGSCMIVDNRSDCTKPENFLIDYAKAKEIMSCALYNGSPHQTWALEKGFGVVIGDHYIPLVTAHSKLLLEFESSSNSEIVYPGIPAEC